MKKLVSIFTLLLLFIFLGINCDNTPTGDFHENEPPTTFMTIEKINRDGEFRLSSQINISWWGNDKDGFIVGYEYAINDTSESAWTFTEKTDSTFILPITEGQSIDDVLFKIRAVDNDGARDPIGARLVYPIVNSDPSVSLKTNETPPDTLFSIASFGWTVDDPDGLGNIASTEIAINDTINGWIEMPIPDGENSVFISINLEDDQVIGEQEGQVYIGRSYTTAQGLTVPGLKVGERNTFYVRATDNAGAVSAMDSVSWFIKPRVSNTLFINDFGGANSLTAQEYHLALLDSIGLNPDIWMINDKEVQQEKVDLSDAFPTVLDPTLKKTLAKWDHIYWVSNDIDRNITYALDITEEFFDNNGTMFVSIPMKNMNINDEIFSFLPVDSLGVLEGIQTDFLLRRNSLVSPTNEINSDTLVMNKNVTGNYPMKPISNATSLYTADYYATTVLGFNQDYTKFESVAIENPEKNLIYFGVEMTNVDDFKALANMLDIMLIDRLNFKQ